MLFSNYILVQQVRLKSFAKCLVGGCKMGVFFLGEAFVSEASRPLNYYNVEGDTKAHCYVAQLSKSKGMAQWQISTIWQSQHSTTAGPP
jgi:hypothetical protein